MATQEMPNQVLRREQADRPEGEGGSFQQQGPPARDAARRALVWLRLVGFGAGLALAFVGQSYCGLRQGDRALIFYGVAGLVTLISLSGSQPALLQRTARTGDRQTVAAGPPSAKIRDGLAIFLIGVAAYPSLYWRNIEVPPGIMHDEARQALEALGFYSAGFSAWWGPSDAGAPAVYSAIMGLLFRCFGPTLHTFRSVNATYTLLTAILLYAYVRRTGGRLLGAVTAILFVHCLWVAHLSRWGFTMSWSMLGTWIAFLGLSVALARWQERPDLSPLTAYRWLPYAWAGFGLIFAQYGYMSGRLALPAAAATILIAYVSRADFAARNWAGVLAMAIAFVAFATPWFWVLPVRPDFILARGPSLGIHNDVFAERSFQPVLTNLIAHLQLFNYIGDRAAVNNVPGLPLLHFLVAPIAVMGMVVSLRFWRSLVSMLPLLWFCVLLQSGILSRVVEVPKAHRILTVAPILYAAVGLWFVQGRALLESALCQAGRVAIAIRSLVGCLLLGLLAVHAFDQYRLYFVTYKTHPSVHFVFSALEDSLYETLKARGQAARPIVDAGFLSQQMRFYTFFDGWIRFVPMSGESLVASLPSSGPVHLYLHPTREEAARILAAGAGGTVTLVTDPVSPDRWWCEVFLPEAANAREVLTQQPELFGHK